MLNQVVTLLFIGLQRSKYRTVSKWNSISLFLLTLSFLVSPLTFAQVKKPSPTPIAQVVAANKRIEDLKAQIRKTPRNLKLVIDLAQEFYNVEDYEKTTLLLWKQVEKLNHDGLSLLLRAHDKRRDFEQVIKVSEIIVVKYPKDAEAYTLQGLAQFSKIKISDSAELKKSKERLALEAYKKAIEADLKYQPAYDAIEKIYDNPKRPNYYELRMLYQDMIDNLGGRFEFYSKLCKINALDGVNETAAETCNKSIQLNDEIPENYGYLGKVYRQMGNSEKGMKVLKDASDKFPKSDFILETYAHYLEEDKNYIDAYKYFDQCVSVDATNQNCLAGAAAAGVQIQKYEKSLQYLASACAIDRKYSVLARKLASQVRASKAKDWLRAYEIQAEKCAGH